jgi:hypothetical protein
VRGEENQTLVRGHYSCLRKAPDSRLAAVVRPQLVVQLDKIDQEIGNRLGVQRNDGLGLLCLMSLSSNHDDRTAGLESHPACPVLADQVRQVELTGPDLRAALKIGPHRLLARFSASCALHVRDQVKIAINMRRVSWFDRATGAALASRNQQAASASQKRDTAQNQT